MNAPATNAEKILHIIKTEGRFLYRKEIIALAEKYNIIFGSDIKSSLSPMVKDKLLVIFMYQGNAGVYGLPSFVNIRGAVIKSREYIPNKAYEKVNANQYARGFTEGERYANGKKVRPSRKNKHLVGLKIIADE